MNKMFYVYILYSERIDKYYVGFSENPDNRLEFHNSPFNKIWTKRGQPWVLLKILEFDSKTEALRVEKFIKKQKSKSFIQMIILEGWNDSCI